MSRRPEDQRTVTGGVTMDAMWADVLARNTASVPPLGAVSTREFAERIGLSRCGAEKRLWSEQAAGLMATGLFLIKRTGGHKLTRYWWPVLRKAA